jgi:hypothetical protein
MAQFIAFDPKAEVSGVSMLGIITVMGEKVIPILAAHGMANIQAEQWYPIQPYLDFYKEIYQSRNGMINLISAGRKVPENAVFPPQIDSITSALLALDEAYHMNHRGGYIGHYHAKIISGRQVDIIAETPFPCDLDFGIVQGLANRFKPARSNLLVYHDLKNPCRKHDGDKCVYHVTW